MYQDPYSNYEVPLRADRDVPLRADCEVPSRAGSQAPPLVRHSSTYFRAFLSVFEPLASPHSLGPIGHECEFCTALHFIQEAIAPKQERLLFKSCCKKGDAYLELLKGVPPYLQSLYKS
jgi:hypothetical protein